MACKTEVIPESERYSCLVTYEQDIQFMRNTERNKILNEAIQKFVKKTLADNVPISKIAEYTSLSESEVKAIAAKLNQQKNINQPL